MKNILTLLLLLIIFSSNSYSQNDNEIINLSENQKEESNFKNKFFSGGNFGIQFGTITLIDISPLIGYNITEKFAAGAGITYQYYKDSNYDFKINVFGGRLFARYYIFEKIFLHSEVEYLRYNYNASQSSWSNDKVDITNFLVGGGYRQWLGGNLYATLIVLWNLNESEYSLYNNPIIRIGINAGF